MISSFILCGSAATVQLSGLCLSSEHGTPVAARGRPFPTEIGNCYIFKPCTALHNSGNEDRGRHGSSLRQGHLEWYIALHSLHGESRWSSPFALSNSLSDHANPTTMPRFLEPATSSITLSIFVVAQSLPLCVRRFFRTPEDAPLFDRSVSLVFIYPFLTTAFSLLYCTSCVLRMRAWAEDAAARCVCVLTLDRFGDYSSR